MSARSSARRGRTLNLYLVDGSPLGVITAELGISSVRAAVASRTALPELVKREEASRTGVYLLVGPDPDLPGRQVYVGESDQVRARLAAHDADQSKEFASSCLRTRTSRRRTGFTWKVASLPRSAGLAEPNSSTARSRSSARASPAADR